MRLRKREGFPVERTSTVRVVAPYVDRRLRDYTLDVRSLPC